MRSYAQVPTGTAVPYLHRDPAYLAPATLAELEAADRRRARYERDPDPGGQAARRQADIARYAELRAEGKSGPQAARVMRINLSTGRSYERARKKLTQEDT